MTEEILSLIEKKLNEHRACVGEDIAKVIKETVNGKIDKIDKKLDDHIQKIEPVLALWGSGKVLGESFKWLGGVGVAFLALQAIWKSITGH